MLFLPDFLFLRIRSPFAGVMPRSSTFPLVSTSETSALATGAPSLFRTTQTRRSLPTTRATKSILATVR
ncbi:MAG: hypothetical protein DRP63_10270 [Planctomycetota bacterium]|nr:MAG: hypothetical protein DRP63_10270 [Planctomycetota bacterium]